MTDFELVRKKLALIESCVREIQEMVRPAEIQTDLVQQRFAERTLLIAIQASLDAAAHIVSDDRLGEPRNNRELFEILGRNGWIPEELVEALILALLAANQEGLALREIRTRLAGTLAEWEVKDDLALRKQLELIRARGHGRGAYWGLSDQ